MVIKENGRYKETVAAFTRQTLFLGDYSYLYQHELEIDYWKEGNQILINGVPRGLWVERPDDLRNFPDTIDHFYLQDRYLLLGLDALKVKKNSGHRLHF